MTVNDGSHHSAKKKLAFFLPNSFTALNMGCGFLAMLLALEGNYYIACLILILGGIFDTVDGRVARLTGTQSHFGEQFDSLSDLISFGMAPAVLIYSRFFEPLDRVGLVVCFFFLLCGALRLARFNTNIEKVKSDFFQGLPIPSAAMALVGLVLLSTHYQLVVEYPLFVAAYVFFYAILMISNIPFNSFKSSSFIKKHRRLVLFLMFILVALTVLHEQLMIFIVVSVYVLSSLIYFSTHKDAFENIFQWTSEEDEKNEE